MSKQSTYINESDFALAKRVLAGDEEAFSYFFNEYFDRVFRYVFLRVNSDKALAEDLTQAAFCEAIQSLRTYRGEAALFTWLCAIARFQVSAFYRKNQNEHNMSEALIEGAEAELYGEIESILMNEGAAQDCEAMKSEKVRIVNLAMDNLPRKYRHILRWKYVEDRPVSYIAEVLGLGQKATDSLLVRARAAFKQVYLSFADDHAPSIGANPQRRRQS